MKALNEKRSYALVLQPIARKLPQMLTALAGAMVLLLGSLPAHAVLDDYTNTVARVSRLTMELLRTPLTTSERQSLHAANFHSLSSGEQLCYLHAVAFQIGAIVAVREPLPLFALAEYLETADPSEFFSIEASLPQDDAMVIQEALREVNASIANEIAANAALQRAIRSGAINGYTFPGGGGTGAIVD
jgi:hypothetical protein